MNLFGWDAVYATTIKQANNYLINNTKNLLSSFSCTDKEYSAKGDFGAWQIVPGGSGQLLHLEITIKSGSITVGGNSADLSGCSAIFEIALKLIPSGNGAKHLCFNFKAVGKKTGGDPDEGLIVSLNKVKDPDGKLNSLQKALFPEAIASSLVAHADTISHIFATIDMVPSAKHSWLKPAYSEYLYLMRRGRTCVNI